MTDKRTLSEISHEKCELEMAPMIDVTFLLLIFFPCTLKFKVPEAKLQAHLPTDVGVINTNGPPLEKMDIRIEVANPGARGRRQAPSDFQ